MWDFFKVVLPVGALMIVIWHLLGLDKVDFVQSVLNFSHAIGEEGTLIDVVREFGTHLVEVWTRLTDASTDVFTRLGSIWDLLKAPIDFLISILAWILSVITIGFQFIGGVY